jgi:hypothetical protein
MIYISDGISLKLQLEYLKRSDWLKEHNMKLRHAIESGANSEAVLQSMMHKNYDPKFIHINDEIAIQMIDEYSPEPLMDFDINLIK